MTNYITIEEIKYTELSVRSYNVCCLAKITTIQEMHEFLVKNEDFLSIKNCGRKSNMELLSIYKQYYIPGSINNNFETDLIVLPNSVKFEETIDSEFFKLSVRAKHCLLKHFKEKPKWTTTVKAEFIDKIFKTEQLKNVGAKTALEIDNFIETTKGLFEIIYKEDLTPTEKIALNLKNSFAFKITDIYFLEKVNLKDLPIITFSAKHLNQLSNFDNIEIALLENYFELSTVKLTLEEIGYRFHLTKERVRQKRKKALEKLVGSKTILKSLVIFSKYNEEFCKDASIVNIDTDINSDSINLEIEEIGRSFSVYILGLIFEDNYYTISKLDKIVKPIEYYTLEKYKIHKRINGHYLIRNNVLPKNCLVNFLEEIFYIVCSRHDIDTVYDVKDLLRLKKSSEAVIIAEKLLLHEYGLETINEKFVIKRNSPKLAYEYVLSALQKINRPAHISEIVSEINRISPDYIADENNLKAAMRRFKNIFIYFGRTSTFGLRKWEMKYENIKGGTIRDIVEEYLNGFECPCHINLIAEYVNKFRKTSSVSILHNLKLTESDRFIFFKDSYIGLSSKKYKG